ncbi:histidine triad (HIT) family protein [Bradyrhizobium japonicum]
MVSNGAYDRDNVFAKILRGDLPSVPVYEDEDVLAFMDAFPQTAGHVLAISKSSLAQDILQIAPTDLRCLIGVVSNIAKAIAAALKPDGILIVQASGRAAGQTVGHFHFHIIPRWEGQPMKGHGHGAMAKFEELQVIARRISACLPLDASQ